MDLEREIKEIKNALFRIEQKLAGEEAAGTIGNPVAPIAKRDNRNRSKNAARPKGAGGELDFDMPARAFFNQYARSLSGPEKFALAVAYLSKGDEAKSISIDEIENHWNKNTSSLGAFNYAHPTRAKDRDLVDSRKKGMYQLRPNWRTIIQ